MAWERCRKNFFASFSCIRSWALSTKVCIGLGWSYRKTRKVFWCLLGLGGDRIGVEEKHVVTGRVSIKRIVNRIKQVNVTFSLTKIVTYSKLQNDPLFINLGLVVNREMTWPELRWWMTVQCYWSDKTRACPWLVEVWNSHVHWWPELRRWMTLHCDWTNCDRVIRREKFDAPPVHGLCSRLGLIE